MLRSGQGSYNLAYNDKYFISQYDKFINRRTNHWASRIAKVFDLMRTQRVTGKRVLDLGCSVGTYAFEFASRGYEATGIDLSEKAVAIARHLAEEGRLRIRYVIGDITQRGHFPPQSFDIIYAGDIIEHLVDGDLNAAIANCQYWLRPKGFLVFHTVPTKYDVVFHKTFAWCLLIPFFFLPEALFKNACRSVYGLFNVAVKVATGRSWVDREKRSVHCHLQTKDSLLAVLKSNGFTVPFIETVVAEKRFLNNRFKTWLFGAKEYFQKDIFGVALSMDQTKPMKG